MQKRGMWVALALVVIAFTGMALRSVLAAPGPQTRLVISLQNLPAVSSHPVPAGWAVEAKIHKPSMILLARGDDGVWRAFANRSTHLGEPVIWSEKHDRFLDDISGAMWDREGMPVAGPAPRGLDSYPVTVEDDHLIIKLDMPRWGPGLHY